MHGHLTRPRPVRRAALLGALVLTLAGHASADVSSWLTLAGGGSTVEWRGNPRTEQGAMLLETGMGSPPAGDVVVGGLFRTHTHFSRGTDVALLVRTATHGFANGGWGGAVDLGPYQRWWGREHAGWSGNLVLGAPWGLVLSVGAGVGDADSTTYAASLGVDLARLTVYRRTGEAWWENPFPAYRPEEAGVPR